MLLFLLNPRPTSNIYLELCDRKPWHGIIKKSSKPSNVVQLACHYAHIYTWHQDSQSQLVQHYGNCIIMIHPAEKTTIVATTVTPLKLWCVPLTNSQGDWNLTTYYKVWWVLTISCFILEHPPAQVTDPLQVWNEALQGKQIIHY